MPRIFVLILYLSEKINLLCNYIKSHFLIIYNFISFLAQQYYIRHTKNKYFIFLYIILGIKHVCVKNMNFDTQSFDKKYDNLI